MRRRHYLWPKNLRVSRTDGKRPDGLTMVPWREGKPLTWDVTVVCPLAESYISDSATNAGSAAEAAATRKAAKYAGLERTHIFQPLLSKTCTMNASAYGFLAGLWLAAWRTGYRSSSMNEVNARRARLQLGWVTVFGRVYHIGL